MSDQIALFSEAPKTSQKEEREDRHLLARKILDEKGYRFINRCNGPPATHESTLEFWCGKKGVVLVQFWSLDKTVTMFCDWSLGQSWDDLREAL